MLKSLYRSTMMMILLLLIVCGIYPALITGIGQALFRDKANGSLLTRGQTVVGSRLIAQGFTKPEYFHPRPSAAGDKGYDAANSNASNLGPTNKKLIDRIAGDAAAQRKDNPERANAPVPTDLVTTSASGLDPHISPEAAAYQVPRVAKARGLAPERLQALVEEHTEGPTFGFLGAPVVNVLELNLALDAGQAK